MQTLQKSYISKLSDSEKILQQQLTEYKKEQDEIQRQILLATNVIPPNIQYTGGEMIWPVAISGTAITSDYGVREHPIQGVVREHTGIDIGNTPTGTPVVAAADGVVTYAGWLGGYGNCVMINHGDGVLLYMTRKQNFNISKYTSKTRRCNNASRLNRKFNRTTSTL